MSEETFQTFAAFGAATIVYLILALAAYQVMARIDVALKIPGTHQVQVKVKRRLLSRMPEEASS